jgi:putative endonuclease
MKTYYTYILRCSDESYYVGVTNDIERRLKEHNSDNYPESYTHWRQPVELVYIEEDKYINNAIKREKQIKKWGRAKKEAHINSEFNCLLELAKKKFDK